MSVVNAVICDRARQEWPKQFGGLATFRPIAFFRVGEGGWEDLGAGRQRRIPDKTFLDLDIAQEPPRASIDRRYSGVESFGYFQKTLTLADFSFIAPSTLSVRCALDFGDYNTKGDASTLIYSVGGLTASPELWELGLFDSAGQMVAYGTFPKEVKDASKQVENVVKLAF